MELVQLIDLSWAMLSLQSLAATQDLTWLWIVLLALGGIGFIVAGLGVSGKLTKRPKVQTPIIGRSIEQSSVSPPGNNKFCPQCGTANPLQAGFCVSCGARFPSQ